MSKGDSATVGFKTGNEYKVQEIVARQNGRKVTYEFVNESKYNWLVVQEQTRGGTVVDEARFKVDDVLYLRRNGSVKEE
jgi:hypothetical protein